MTQDELIELSIAAAKVAGIPPCYDDLVGGCLGTTVVVWLHADSERCFELMCRCDLYPKKTWHCIHGDGVIVPGFAAEYYLDHGGNAYVVGNREQTTRVAILKALVERGSRNE